MPCTQEKREEGIPVHLFSGNESYLTRPHVSRQVKKQANMDDVWQDCEGHGMHVEIAQGLNDPQLSEHALMRHEVHTVEVRCMQEKRGKGGSMHLFCLRLHNCFEWNQDKKQTIVCGVSPALQQLLKAWARSQKTTLGSVCSWIGLHHMDHVEPMLGCRIACVSVVIMWRFCGLRTKPSLIYLGSCPAPTQMLQLRDCGIPTSGGELYHFTVNQRCQIRESDMCAQQTTLVQSLDSVVQPKITAPEH